MLKGSNTFSYVSQSLNANFFLTPIIKLTYASFFSFLTHLTTNSNQINKFSPIEILLFNSTRISYRRFHDLLLLVFLQFFVRVESGRMEYYA